MNRPLPLREFDQIYMKTGDLVVHAELMARRFDGRKIVFVGDGDAIGLAIVHLMNEKVIDYGPSHVTVLDFDERMVNSINAFAADYECTDRIEARLYNVVDALPSDLMGSFEGFHINPPWGQHNQGESVAVFLERAVSLTAAGGRGVIVIADDPTLPWTQQVLQRTQSIAVQNGFVVDEMIPAFHAYHLDDAPELRSCILIVRRIADGLPPGERLSSERMDNFYGRGNPLRVHYVREVPNVSRGRADDRTYQLEPLSEPGEA
jgi:predicted methyltransferase